MLLKLHLLDLTAGVTVIDRFYSRFPKKYLTFFAGLGHPQSSTLAPTEAIELGSGSFVGPQLAQSFDFSVGIAVIVANGLDFAAENHKSAMVVLMVGRALGYFDGEIEVQFILLLK